MPTDPDNLASTESAAPAVNVSGLSHRYAGREVAALSDIQLAIPQGSCFGLLGPNGAGKTTLLSLLTGLLTPQQGVIAVLGHRYPAGAAQIKQQCALVPQEYAFYPALTGRENLEFFAGLYQVPAAERQARILESATLCALNDVLGQRSASYSGGLKRRLNLAIGLLCQPKILYLDEPTVGIDAQSRNFILRGIERLKAQGMTIVYTSHYMEEIEQICDEVAIIDGGQVRLQQGMETLLGGDGCLTIIPEQPLGDDVLVALQSATPCQWQQGQLLIDSDTHKLADVFQALEQHGISIRELNMGRNRLESIYLSITSRELRD